MKFRYYLAISIIFHIIFLFTIDLSKNKDKLLGEKFAPIEILNNKSFKVEGGNSKENSKKLKKNIKTERKIEKEIEKKIEKESKNKNIKKKMNDFKNIKEGDLEINEEKEKKDKKDKNKMIFQKEIKDPINSENKKKGISTGENKDDNEKGSIKGKGKLKITCLKCITPDYPQKALKKGLEGKPLIKVWILTNGSVEKASILRSSGISLIDNAALKAALESIFYPIEYNVTFKIEYDLKLR